MPFNTQIIIIKKNILKTNQITITNNQKKTNFIFFNMKPLNSDHVCRFMSFKSRNQLKKIYISLFYRKKKKSI
jgi:hypothetical protein